MTERRQLRPRIGITTRYDVATERFYLARYYAEAIEAAGGTPLYLPLIPHGEFVNDAASQMDGILLPGSASDVDPLRFGREPHAKLGDVHPLRDETDLLLLEIVERDAVPLLAICYGLQILNVARGGTLIQDIEHQLNGAVQHQQGAPRERPSHTVKLDGESRLAALNNGLKAVVNSHHHQGIETLGSGLVATAWSVDGLIEAAEDSRPDRFTIGVQWHPELGWQKDELSRKLFEAFVDAAIAHASDKPISRQNRS